MLLLYFIACIAGGYYLLKFVGLYLKASKSENPEDIQDPTIDPFRESPITHQHKRK